MNYVELHLEQLNLSLSGVIRSVEGGLKISRKDNYGFAIDWSDLHEINNYLLFYWISSLHTLRL